MRAVLRTLAQCHAKGILHRDIKASLQTSPATPRLVACLRGAGVYVPYHLLLQTGARRLVLPPSPTTAGQLHAVDRGGRLAHQSPGWVGDCRGGRKEAVF